MNTFNERAHSTLFFHHVLPSLGKDLDDGLKGTFKLSCGYFKKQRNSALPQFLYEHFIKIFYKNGAIREFPEGIRDLRQLLMMFYKFEVDFTPEQVENATLKYIEADDSVKTDGYPEGLSEVRKYFTSLLPDDPLDIRPHHANGATADRVSNMNKLTIRRYIPPLMEVYGPQMFFNTHAHAKHWCGTNRTETHFPNARLTFVPKDSRGPRTICMEPHEYMFIQKGLQTKLYDHIENYSPAKGFVNFTDQSVNQRLAYEGSMSQKYATIDLKDASDMVPWNLLRYLLTPEWFIALRATRSARVDMPNGESKTINKYASMGSALCFPIEAMLFWSIARTVCPKVWVYGDDIIVEHEFAQRVIEALEAYGLRINANKTLTTGFFRESCGGDYYKGEDIGYINCKSYSESRFISFCNLITEVYGTKVSSGFIKIHENESGKPVMRHPLSEIVRPQPFVFYTDDCASSSVFFNRRYNSNLQCYEMRWLHEYSPTCSGTIDDYDKFFSWLTVRNASVAPKEESTLSRLLQDVQLKPLYRSKTLYKKIATSLDQSLIYEDRKPRTKYSWGLGFNT
jgi:hypothetical protein